MNRMAAIETAARRRQDDEDTDTLRSMGVTLRPRNGAWWAEFRDTRSVQGPFRTRRDAINAAYDEMTTQLSGWA